MKVLILGASSPPGIELAALLQARKMAHVALPLEDFDLGRQMDLVKAVTAADADLVVHLPDCGGLQEVERDAGLAERCELLNSRWIATLAETSNHLNIPLIHLSSSQVFDGAKKAPYTEEDLANPQSRLGRLLWQGEGIVRETQPRHIILRSDWLFSPADSEWFRRQLQACRDGGGHMALMDRRFSPTPAEDLARVLLAILQQLDCDAQAWGSYHYCALQSLSEAQFVETLVREAARYDESLARCCESLEITVSAPRLPWIPNSVLNCQKIMETFGIKQRSRAPSLTWLLEDLYQVPHVGDILAPAAAAAAREPGRQRGKRKKTARKPGQRSRKKQEAGEQADPTKDSAPPARKAAGKKP